MKGAIVGDIVGSIYEWHNIKSKDFELFAPNAQTGRKPFFTDDTVLTVAVAQALIETALRRTSERNVALVRSMQKWGRLYPNAGYGGRFNSWIYEDNPTAYNSWGNGAPMRCSPAGWLAVSAEDAKNLGRQTAEPTHNHAEGLKAAECTALLIFLARTGADMAELRKTAETYYEIPMIDDVRPAYKFSESSQETMPVALAAFFEGIDFEDSIKNAISVGGDSDTIAAITGSIAEVYYGVPDEIWQKADAFLDNRIRGQVEAFYKIISKNAQ